jgi:exonuclease SbcD
MKSLRLLHFADAHIDIANYGRHDPELALPVRVVDFLKSLDMIVETAISEPVDLVIFAGDAYKDRNPHPTFQREWGKRMMRLSQAGIPTVLLVGNHDVSPASGRAHTLQEYSTLAVPHIIIADRITRLGPDDLGRPVQLITVPWVSRHQLMTREETTGMSLQAVLDAIEERVTAAVTHLVETADPDLPLILVAHANVQGAVYGSERTVMLGHELILSGSLVNDRRLDYVALGHIHRHQRLSAKKAHPPIVYPGSIERIDFGEAKEPKGFVLANVGKGKTEWEFVKLNTRRFLTFPIQIQQGNMTTDEILAQLPEPAGVAGAICRLQLTYPADWESLLDEKAILEHFREAFSIQIQKQRQMERRARLGESAQVEAMTKEELLATYWRTKEFDEAEIEAMLALAKEVLADVGEEVEV